MKIIITKKLQKRLINLLENYKIEDKDYSKQLLQKNSKLFSIIEDSKSELKDLLVLNIPINLECKLISSLALLENKIIVKPDLDEVRALLIQLGYFIEINPRQSCTIVEGKKLLAKGDFKYKNKVYKKV